MSIFLKIFARYSTIIFIILLTLVSFSQYKDQGKFDLYFSLPFAFSIGSLGGFLAAIFIGIFRKLDSAPPWVQPSEYLQVDSHVIGKRLSKIKSTRMLLFTMFLMWLPYGAFIMAINLPIFLIFAYMAAMALISFIFSFSKCPRCNHYFFFRGVTPGQIGDTGIEKINFLFGGGYTNTISSECLNCGLSLKRND